jgi:anti-sigma B factor antagonist
MTTTSTSSKKKRGKAAGRTLRIETDLTIYTALATRDLLLAELAAGDALSIDLSAVGEIDTAGLQLLVLASREAAKAGKNLTFASPSPAVSSVFELCSISALLDGAAEQPNRVQESA